MIQLSDFVSALESEFQLAQKLMQDLKFFFDKKDSINTKNVYQKLTSNAGPLTKLNMLVADIHEDGGTDTFIKNAVLENFNMLNYVPVILKRQQQFAKNNFKNLHKFYKKKKYKYVLEYLDNVEEDEFEKSKLDVAILYFLDTIASIDNEFHESYPLYKSVLKANWSEDDASQIDPIHLNYHDKTEIVRTLLFERLNGEFFEHVNQDEFLQHFGIGPTPTRKLVWKKNFLLLNLLFRGKDLEYELGITFLKVAVQNDYIQMICDHFQKPTGMPFIYKDVLDNERNLSNARINQSKPIISLLQEIKAVSS